MKRVAHPGAVVLFDGRPALVVGIAEGRTIHLKMLDVPVCASCGNEAREALLEDSRMFQERVEPVETVMGGRPVFDGPPFADAFSWHHLDGTECVAGWEATTGECSQGGGPVTPRYRGPR